jgi:hypothetical protein
VVTAAQIDAEIQAELRIYEAIQRQFGLDDWQAANLAQLVAQRMCQHVVDPTKHKCTKCGYLWTGLWDQT